MSQFSPGLGRGGPSSRMHSMELRVSGETGLTVKPTQKPAPVEDPWRRWNQGRRPPEGKQSKLQGREGGQRFTE